MAVLCHQWVTQPGTTHLVDQVCRQNQFGTHAVLLMPLRGRTGHEMHARGFASSENSRLQKQTWPSKSAWCLWIVHECDFHLQAKNGFQYL